MSAHHKVDMGDTRSAKPVDLNDIEMVFGTPNLPKNGVKPDVHFIDNEKKHTTDTHDNKNGTDIDGDTNSAQPLLEPDKDPPKPPLAGPEIDDLDHEHPAEPTPFPGIDDGLFDPIDKDVGLDGESGDTDKEIGNGNPDFPHPTLDEGVGTDDGKWWRSTDVPDHPYGFGSENGLESKFGVDGLPISPPPGSNVDVNTYQQKKNLAQGMMDLALLSANANQLRYVLESSINHPYYYPSITFITLSIIFQIAVGVGLIMNSRYDVTDKADICKANKINNMTVLGVFLITIVNVFITAFSVATPPTAVVVSGVQQAG